MIGGKYTDDLCIAVLVDQKKPLEQLKADDVVPAEIDGVKTDVREIPRPRLLMAANPSNLIATRSADNLSVTFSGEHTPGAGLVVLLLYSAGPVGGSPLPHVGFYSTIPPDTLNDVAKNVAEYISQSAVPGLTATHAGAQVTLVVPDPRFTATINSCTVTAADDKSYLKDHLRGGIQIWSGGIFTGGTLGLLATTAPTPQDPQGRVVAITCQHVVAPAVDLPTKLIATANGNQITFSGSPTPTNSLVQIFVGSKVVDNLFQTSDVFCTTQAGEALNHFVGRVRDAVNQSTLGVNATQGNPPHDLVLTLDLPPDTSMNCATFGPIAPDSDVRLTADAVGPQLTFRGSVSHGNYGIYIRVNASGSRRTCGVFLNPSKDQDPTSIASAMAKVFNKLPDNYRGSVTATPTGPAINFDQAQSVDCKIRNDIQVGQPDNSFGSTCSHCCSHRIGRVLDAKLSGDIAVIQLDAGQKWVPEIEGIGLVSGAHFLEPGDLHLPVQKRGRAMPQPTLGMIDLLQLSGEIFGDGGSFDRHYVNAILVSSQTNSPFALPSDSGAAVTDVLGGVVGILFGGLDTVGFVTPIDQIINDDFPDLQLNVAPVPEAGHAPGDVRTVPKSAMAAATEEDAAVIALPQPFLEKRLAQVENEISSTREGFEYAELVKRHFAETQRLVNSNRRVATVWHRNGGPQILQAFLNMLQRRDEPLPMEINGNSFADCLERIKEVFARYASPEFAADISRLAPRLESFAGLTYNQLLAALHAESGD